MKQIIFLFFSIILLTSFVEIITTPLPELKKTIGIPIMYLADEHMIVKRQTPADSGGSPASMLTQIPGQLQNLGQLQSGFSSLMNTMKDGKMVVGGFSFFVIPAPDVQQLQGLPGLPGLPQLPIPGGGGSTS